MDEKPISITEIRSDLKYIKDSLDEIKVGLKEHEVRIRQLETSKEKLDAINQYKTAQDLVNYRKLRNYYTLFLVLFTGLNIAVDVILKVF